MDPTIALHVKAPEFDFADEYLKARQQKAYLSNLGMQSQLNQERLSDAQAVRAKRERDLQDQRVVQDALGQTGGSWEKVSEAVRGRVSGETQAALDDHIAKQREAAAKLTKEQRGEYQANLQAFAGLTRSAQASPQDFARALGEARSRGLIDDAKYAEWSALDWPTAQQRIKALDVELLNSREALEYADRTAKAEQEVKDRETEQANTFTPEELQDPTKIAPGRKIPAKSLSQLKSGVDIFAPVIQAGTNWNSNQKTVTVTNPRTGETKTYYSERGAVAPGARQGRAGGGEAAAGGAVWDRIEKIKDVEMRAAWRTYEATKGSDPKAAEERDKQIVMAQKKYDTAIIKAGGSVAPRAAGGDTVLMRTPDGRVAPIPRANVERAKELGAVEVQ